jgi:ABC-type nitrate/sulfonate/bicarbonate transport system substrate-binding protein
MTTRREVLKTIGASAAAFSLPAIVRAQDKTQDKRAITIMTPFGYQADFLEMMNAKSGGYFAREGLDVKVLGGHGTGQATQQLIAGKVEMIRASAIDLMRAVDAAKAPLVAIATIYQASTFFIVSPKDKPVKSAEDLKGKTVGLVSVGGTTETFVDLILQKGGLKKDDIKRQVTGNNPGALQIMQQGRVDCFICSLNVLIALEKMNAPIVSWSTDRYAPMPGQCYVTTRDIVEKDPKVLMAVMRAMKGSVLEMLDKPLKPIFERAEKDFEIPGMRNLDLHIAIEDRVAHTLWLSQGRNNLLRNVPALWKSGVDALNGSGIAHLPDPQALYTNTFVDAVMKG